MDDVKQGYFDVYAIKGQQTKRFIVGLDYLNYPAFLRLLDQAEEEFRLRENEPFILLGCPE